MAVKAIPDGYHSVTPYLIVRGAAQALEFYTNAFGAIETVRMDGPGGTVGHAEFRIGDSMVMIADENAANNAEGPEILGGSPGAPDDLHRRLRRRCSSARSASARRRPGR